MIDVKICDKKWFNSIKRDGFGIYLFHPMIIYIVFYIFRDIKINPYILCALAILSSYELSVLFTAFVRKMKWNILIGE